METKSTHCAGRSFPLGTVHVSPYKIEGLQGNDRTAFRQASRVVVGLFKQTMTLAAAVVTDLTTEEDRALGLGQLRTATTLAWTVGQLLGGVLSAHHRYLPAAVCVAQYVVASAITLAKLDLPAATHASEGAGAAGEGVSAAGEGVSAAGGPSVWRTARRLWSAEGVGAVLGLMLLHRLLARALSTMGSYYELDRCVLRRDLPLIAAP